MRLFLIAIAFSAALLSGQDARQAKAEDVMRIAAVVNDDVISFYDLETRIRLVIFSSKLPNDIETRRRIAPQILRSLIDERIKLQEAKRMGITVDEKDIEAALADIEKRNRLPKGGLDEQLRSNGIDPDTLHQQAEATLAWVSVIRRSAARKINVSDDEVEDAFRRHEENKNKPLALLSEIFLPVDGATSENEIRQVAMRIMQQVAQGASFTALASQFSQSATAAVGGDLGWVEPGRMSREIDEAIANANPGQLVGPVRTPAGYHIIAFRDRRIPNQDGGEGGERLTLSQFVLPLGESATEEQAAAITRQAREASQSAKSCAELEAAGKSLGSALSGSLGTINPEKLPPQIRAVVERLPENTAGEPFRSAAGITVLMVCERSTPQAPSDAAVRQRLKNQIAEQRAEMISRRMLRDLHRNAFLDLRI
ncbi:MAG: peptidylprolyl isomerase [Rhodospirillales bacterium]|nr:peptidylprolyl isomerase [Rhodospirillales bacterium]MCW9002726.1 peptidylprolyl isomerase [Rhodospirillales bacterium]